MFDTIIAEIKKTQAELAHNTLNKPPEDYGGFRQACGAYVTYTSVINIIDNLMREEDERERSR